MKCQFLTISEAAREAGVNRSSIQRWIAAGRMQKRKAGKVSLKDVVRCRDAKVTGRPHGEPAAYSAIFDSEVAKPLAQPFLETRAGLRRLKAILQGVVSYHIAAGRKNALLNVLTKAFEQIPTAENRQVKERELNARRYSRSKFRVEIPNPCAVRKNYLAWRRELGDVWTKWSVDQFDAVIGEIGCVAEFVAELRAQRAKRKEAITALPPEIKARLEWEKIAKQPVRLDAIGE